MGTRIMIGTNATVVLVELDDVFGVDMTLVEDDELPRALPFRVRQDGVGTLGDDAVQAIGFGVVHLATERSAQQDISVPVGTLENH